MAGWAEQQPPGTQPVRQEYRAGLWGRPIVWCAILPPLGWAAKRHIPMHVRGCVLAANCQPGSLSTKLPVPLMEGLHGLNITQHICNWSQRQGRSATILEIIS